MFNKMRHARLRQRFGGLQALAVGLLLLLCLPGFSQNAEISGQVSRNGLPLDFLVIKLQDGAGHQLNATMTDELGGFEFTHLAPGSYALVGEYQGFPIHAKLVLAADAHVVMRLTPSLFRWVPEHNKPRAPHPIFTTNHTPANAMAILHALTPQNALGS
jgi:hypothetical protein